MILMDQYMRSFKVKSETSNEIRAWYPRRELPGREKRSGLLRLMAAFSDFVMSIEHKIMSNEGKSKTIDGPALHLTMENRLDAWLRSLIPKFTSLRTAFDDGTSLLILLKTLWPGEQPPESCRKQSGGRETRLAALEWAEKLGISKRNIDERTLTAEANSNGPDPELLDLLRRIRRFNELDSPSRRRSYVGGVLGWARARAIADLVAKPFSEWIADKVSPLLSVRQGIALKRSASAEDFRVFEQILLAGKRMKDVDECFVIRRRADALRLEKRHQESYDRLKLSIYGLGETDYSAVLTALVEERIDAFCALIEIDEWAIEAFQKSFQLISKYTIWYHYALIAYELRCLADAEPDVDKAIRMRKEVIFWCGMELALAQCSEVRKWMDDEMIKLEAMLDMV
jgi:hypothetical protein